MDNEIVCCYGFFKCGLYMDYILKTPLTLNIIVFCYSIQHAFKDISIIVECGCSQEVHQNKI